MTHGLRLLLLLSASPVLSPLAQAMDFAAGFAAMEEGDDRLRPAMSLHVGWPQDFESKAYYYGRTYGPVKEETILLTAVKSWGLFKSKFLTAHFGAAVMDERTELTFDGDHSEESESEDNLNAGAVFGIAAQLPKSQGPLFLQVSWDSHVFAAGLAGGLFLSSGRKQAISIVGGVALK